MTTNRLLQLLSRSVVAFALLFSLVGATSVFAGTIYVSSSTGNDALDGATPGISGGSGPKATLAAAYAVATAGDTISIEAGTYTEAFSFGLAKGVTIEVRAPGGVTVATFTGVSTIAVGAANSITLNSGVGSVAVSGGAFTLTSGTLNLGVGKLAFTAATALTVTGGTATGASPAYTGAVTAGYTKTAAGSAGTEIPASLNGGTLTVNGVVDTTFPAALTAGGITTAVTATGVTTFSSTVTVAGNVLHNGDDISFGTISLTNGTITSTGGGADQTFTAGAVTFAQSANGIAINNTSATSTMTLASVTATGFNDNGADETFTGTITNAGTMTVSGAIVNNGSSDANDNDTSSWSLTNSGTMTIGASASLAGSLTNSGTMTIGASSSLAGVLDNTGGTLALGSTTLTLSGAGPHVNMGTITGASSTVSVTGASAVPASAGVAAPAFDIAGNLTVSGIGGIGAVSVAGNVSQTGSGGVTGTVRVGGNLTMAGTGGMAGSIDVAGSGTFSGTTTFTTGVGVNDVDGAVTISGTVSLVAAGLGDLIAGSVNVTSTGSLTINAGATLTSNGNVDTSNGGTFVGNGVGATLAFLVPGGSTATYTPGPNTVVDVVTLTRSGATGVASMTMGQSVQVVTAFTTTANTNVNLGNFAIRMTGATTATINGTVTTSAGQSGALTFEAAGQTLAGLGDISNIIVMVGGGNTLAVPATVNFTGTLTLASGGITVTGDISPLGSLAEVRRNSADATTLIGGAGTFNIDAQTYILTIFGNGAAAAGTEYAATGITTLNIQGTTTTYTTALAASVGNVNVDAGTTLTSGVATTVTGTVSNAGTIAGAGMHTLTGAGLTHTNTGGFTAPVTVLNTGITINGSATLATAAPFLTSFLTNLTVGDAAATAATGAVTLNNIQQVEGALFVNLDGVLTIGLVQDDATAGTGNGDEGSVQGAVTVIDGGSLTWMSDAIVKGAIIVGAAGDATVATFNFNGHVIHMPTAAQAFTADWNASLGASGRLEADNTAAISTNANNLTPSTPTSALPGLQVDAAATIAGATRVVGTTSVNASWGTAAASLTLSGTVNLANGFSTTANVTIIGTTVNVTTAHTITGSLTLNATTVDFIGLGAAADALTVTGAYTHTAGAVSQTNVDINAGGLFTQTAGNYSLSGGDLNLDAGAVYVAGTFSAAGATDEVRFTTGGAINTNGGTWMIPNADFDVAMVIDGTGGTTQDELTIGNRLEVSANLTAGNASAAGTPTGVINLGDGSGTFMLLANGGNVIDAGADGTVTYGADVTTVDYSGTSATLQELPSTFDTLRLNTPAGVVFADARAITVNNLDLDAGPNSIDENDDNDNSITVTAGGTVNVGLDVPFGAGAGATIETFTPADGTNYNVIYDALATATSNQSWAAAQTPNVTVTPLATGAAGTVALHASRTAMDVTVQALDTFDPVTFNLTIGGVLTGASTAIQSSNVAPGSVIFAGAAAQTINGGLFYNGNVTVNNANGVTLTNGNLNTSDNGTNTLCGLGVNTLTMTAGTITTGTNRVLLCHTNTTLQGYTRTSGSIFGNVQVVVDGTASPNVTDRIVFPTGDANGNYSPFAITFNTPNQLGADPVLVVGYNDSDPMGTNGLPISAVDELNNPFEIGRYARDFHWGVTSTPSVTPSIDYDVEFRAEGYANFVGEDIERSRALRRQSGNVNNFWIKVANGNSDNDNYAVSATEPVLVARNAVGAINADGVLFAIGLGNNMMATNPAAITLNAGNTEVIDLSALITGGAQASASPLYTYAVTNGDASVATGATASDNLTVTGVGAGVSTVAVTGTDAFGATATTTVSVTVNAAFVVGTDIADLAAVNLGAADATVDGAASHAGGTSTYTYGVVTSDAAVATAVVSAAGEVTVTFAGVGTATITLTATDAEGDTVVDSFDVTVNAAMSAGGTFANLVMTEGTDADVDASAEFAGGTVATDYAYGAASDNDDVASASAAGATVTVDAVGPYVLVGGAVTADAAPATVTVTATDDLGAMSTSTFTVDVNPVPGNVDGTGGPSPDGASLTLEGYLGLVTLTAKQSLAADFDAVGGITPFDAAQIFSAFFGGKDALIANADARIEFGEVTREGNLVNVSIMVTGNINDVVSAGFEAFIDPAFAKIQKVTSELGDGWLFGYATDEEGNLKVGFAGLGSMTADGTVATLTLQLNNASAEFSIGAEGAVNANPIASIDAVEVVEIPETFTLHGNYPNPFNPSTTVSFDLPETADVEVQIFDMIGRQVMVLPATTMQAGAKRSVQLNASQLASGTYFYRVIAKMESKTLVDTGRMMLVK